MLVKTIQKETELDISIGPDVVLRVRWHRGQVKLGIDAPRDMRIEAAKTTDSGPEIGPGSHPLMRKP